MRFEERYTVKDIAQFLGRDFEGDPMQPVLGINEIHMVEPGDLTFVDLDKYYNTSLNSAATTIIIDKKVERPEGKALIFSDDPFSDFVKLIKRFMPFIPSSKMISDTAQIGEGTHLQPNVFVGNHVKIGKNCIIHAGVVINDYSIIGDNCVINPNSVIGGDGFYFKRRPEKHYDKFESCGRAVLGDNVEIGSNCTIDRGISGDTVVGDGSKLDNLIMVGHDTVIGKNCLIASQCGIAGVVTIEDNVTLWGQVGVQKDLVIKEGAIVLGQAGVAKTIEGGGKQYFGSPAIDAREKMKEFAMLKHLPELVQMLNEYKNSR